MQKRLFIAVPLTPNIRQLLINYQNRHRIPGLRYPPAPNWHLTLVFLGMVSERRIHQLVHILAATSEHCNKFSLQLQQIGPMPLSRPRMLWLQFVNNYERYRKLIKKIRNALGNILKLPAERDKIIPHVTVARLGKGFKFKYKSALKHEFKQAPRFPVKEIILYSSKLSPLGSTYQELYRFDLTD